MQDNTPYISDELLTKYVSGGCTPEEETQVLDYIGQSDENLDELTAIADAIQTQHDADKASIRPTAHSKRRYWSIAASVAILMVVAAGLLFPRHPPTESTIQIDPAPMQATADTLDSSDSTDIQLLINEE